MASAEYQNVGFFRSIQGQILSWTLVVGLLPLIVVGVATYIIAQDALRTAVVNKLEATIDLKAQRIEGRFDRWMGTAEIVADLPSIKGSEGNAVTIGIEDLQRYANRSEDRSTYQRIYNDAFGALIAASNVFDSAIEVVYLTDAQGNVLISTDQEKMPEGSSIVQRGFFVDSLRSSVVGDIRHDDFNEDQLIYSVATPVIAPGGQVVGLVVIQVNTIGIEAILEDRTGLGSGGETYLVDGDTSLMITRSQFIDVDTRLNPDYNLGDFYATQQVFSGESPLGNGEYIDYRGESVLGAWRHIPSLNWAVIGEIDQAQAYMPINNMAALIAVVVVVATVLIVIVAYLVARSISQPIRRMAGSASRIAGGNLEERVDIRSQNEIGMLGQAFNDMADDLRDVVESERESKEALEKAVGNYTGFVQRVANGDLKSRLELNGNGDNGNDLYQLGVNLNVMVESLSSMAWQVREASQSLSAAAAEIQAAMTQQTATATEQDVTVTQTVATVEEVRTTVTQTAERAQSVADASQQSVNVSRSGEEAITRSIDGMRTIQERVEGIAENILVLSERTQQIGEIIETVNALADQSKLLALNASIEAARAGEEGRGFAVVAMEVRQLAEQSRDATARVRDILNEIQQATNTAVMVTEEGSKGAEQGMSLVTSAGESIRELASTIEVAAQAAVQIAASTHQQTNGMDQLNSAMLQIKQATTQTAATTRQTEQSLHDLTEMARRLEEAAARYELAD